MNDKLTAHFQDLICLALEQEHKPTKINISYGGDHINVMLLVFPEPKYFRVTSEGFCATDPWEFVAVGAEVDNSYKNVDIFWPCPNCGQDTNRKEFIVCCSHGCLKMWMDKNRKQYDTLKVNTPRTEQV